jgi:hypothetical protein
LSSFSPPRKAIKFGKELLIRIEDRIECKLYNSVRADLHDKAFSVGTRTLYYYCGAIGNWGKGRFRISWHSKPTKDVAASQTHGVLHSEI